MNFFQRIFNPKKKSSQEQMMKIAADISNTAAEEVNCDEAFDVMHEYVELMSQGKDASIMWPKVHLHLQMCKDCREELEALLKAMRA